MKALTKFSIATAAIALSTLASSAAQAISVTQTNDLTALKNAITAGNGGIVINSISISGQLGQFGTYTNLSGTYGIGSGIVISTGNVNDYNTGANTSAEKTTVYGIGGIEQTPTQQALLSPITGSLSHFDVAQIEIDFDLQNGFDTIFFNTVFGSEEFPRYVNEYVDGFGLFVNGQNIAFSGGQPVNINNSSMTTLGGTELNGVLAPNNNPVLTFSKVLGNGSKGNKLTFIIADTRDAALDSTAYFSALGGAVPQPVPVPPAVAGVILAGGLLSRKLIKRSSKNKKVEIVA